MQGFQGWGQRSQDSTPSWYRPPGGPRLRPGSRRGLVVGIVVVLGLIALGALAVLAVERDRPDSDEIAAVVAELQRPPVVHDARVVTGGDVEVDVDGPADADYCLEAPAHDWRDVMLCRRPSEGTVSYQADSVGVAADELVGSEVTVTARTSLTETDLGHQRGERGPYPPDAAVESDRSRPAELRDAR